MNIAQLFLHPIKSSRMDPGEVREEKEPLIIDWIIAAYAAVVLLVQILFLISPVMTFFSKTPLYSIQTYLGFLGGVLILIDMFTSRGLWRGAYCIFLYAICALAAVAAVRMIDYGMKENIYKLCWTAIQIALIYSCAYRLKGKQWRKCILYFYAGLVTIWFAACCVSLYQYVLQIGYTYVVNPLAQDPSVSRQGFYDNRLFGIFSTLNHAAFVSVFFFLIGLIYLIKARKVMWKVILGVVELVLGCHILLSGSRSALVAVLVCLLCLFWHLIRNRSKHEGWRRNIISGVLAALLTVLCAFGVQQMKAGLAIIPKLYGEPADVSSALDERKEAIDAEEKNVLQRKNLEDDVSNGRWNIWKDYISLYGEVGLIGLSPGNYMGYILENHPELYIVKYIKENYPDKYNSGTIYHAHSGYLTVYVAAGLAGGALLIVFMVLCIRQVFRKIRGTPRLSMSFAGAFLIVLAGAISVVFDIGLFFQNNPHTTMFWIALGSLMKESTEPEPRAAGDE